MCSERERDCSMRCLVKPTWELTRSWRATIAGEYAVNTREKDRQTDIQREREKEREKLWSSFYQIKVAIIIITKTMTVITVSYSIFSYKVSITIKQIQNHSYITKVSKTVYTR